MMEAISKFLAQPLSDKKRYAPLLLENLMQLSSSNRAIKILNIWKTHY